jgi:hypothetical protein
MDRLYNRFAILKARRRQLAGTLSWGEQRSLVDFTSRKAATFVGITPKIKLVERGPLKREGGRVKPFVDRRLEMTMEDT